MTSAGSAGQTARRELSDSTVTIYVAGSITAITLASATYLFYLRCQRSRDAPHEHRQGTTAPLHGAPLSESCSGESVGDEAGEQGPEVRDAPDVEPGRGHIQTDLLQQQPTRTPLEQALPGDRPASRFRGLLDGLWGLWRGAAPAAAAPMQPDSMNRRWIAADSTAAHDTAGNRVDQLRAPEDLGLDEDAARRDAAPPGPRDGAQPDGPDADAAARAADADVAEEHEEEEGATGGVAWQDLLDEVEDELEVPDEFKDPISLNVMMDPVVLCATGQVYEYTTLKNWFRTGNRLCPKTNIEVLDVQVVRLPWLKARVLEWLQQHGRTPAPQADPLERLGRLHPSLVSWVHAVRNDTGEKRSAALADIYELLRQWEAGTDPEDVDPALAAKHNCTAQVYAGAMERLHRYVRGAVMDEAIWLLRYGNPYLQGVAASILAYCDAPGEVSWLAAVAAVPAVSLCMSQNRYTSQAATRLLYNLARGGQVARRALVGAGAVTALISVLATDRQEYGYCRDRAAATLALLIRDADGRSLLLRYGLTHLVAMVCSGVDRWEQRDAATVLLKLGLSPEHLRGMGLSAELLVCYWCCSRSWLEGHSDDPTHGYLPTERQAAAAVAQLRAGTLTHAALTNLISGQDNDVDLSNLDMAESDDPWGDDAHPTEESAAAWRAVEAEAKAQMAAAVERSVLERQMAEERRRREAGEAAAIAEPGALQQEPEEGGGAEVEDDAPDEGGEDGEDDDGDGAADDGQDDDEAGDGDGEDDRLGGDAAGFGSELEEELDGEKGSEATLDGSTDEGDVVALAAALAEACGSCPEGGEGSTAEAFPTDDADAVPLQPEGAQ